MRTIKIYYADGDNQVTSINGTNEEITAYYVGQVFNIGRGENDYCVKCVGVTFLD